MRNIEAKSGKRPEQFLKLATKKGFIKRGKIIASYSEMLKWLKSPQIGLGHVHASAMIFYLRLRTNDPTPSEKMKKWAYNSGYNKKTGKIE